LSITIHPGATALLQRAMQQVLAEVAFQVEAKAKENATPFVDTGFLRSSIQTITPGEDGIAGRAELHTGRSGQERLYTAADTRAARDDEALVVCHADYAYWVERRTPFLLPAAQAVAADVGAIVQRHRL